MEIAVGFLFLGWSVLLYFVFKKYFTRTFTSLREVVQWTSIVSPGCVILNKNGSLQQTFEYRGPDLETVTASEMDATVANINGILKRLSGGWALYADAHRITCKEYPKSQFPDGISAMINEERRLLFGQGEHFETRYYLTLVWLPPDDRTSWVRELFVKRQTKKQHDNYKGVHLKTFQREARRIYDLLEKWLCDIRPLTNDETLTYLHSCVSPKRHPVKASGAWAVADQVVDSGLIPALEPQLGKHHLRTICVRNFPDVTYPGIFDELNKLNFEYRWTSRFIPLDKSDALNMTREITRKWFNNRQTAFEQIREAVTQTPSALINNDSVKKMRDSEEVALEIASNRVSYGFYTTTITILDLDEKRIEKKVQLVEKTINGLGFQTITESYNAVEAWFGTLPGHCGANIRIPPISSMNWVHLFPLSATWAGPETNKHWGGPPLVYAQTSDRTPFRFDLHTNGPVGHTLIVGPTGQGKSALLALMAVQSRKYESSQCFIFDKGGSMRTLCAGLGGIFYDLGKESDTLSFQPLANLDQPDEIEWALEWVLDLLKNENVSPITPEIKSTIYKALESVKASPRELRSMSTLHTYIMDDTLKAALFNYTQSGPYGKLFDANDDTLTANPFQVFEMETLIETKISVVEPTLRYLFHRLEKYFGGNKRTLLMLDEAWTYLLSETFKKQINKWLRELRKKDVDVVFATQSLDEIGRSSIAPIIIDACMTKVYLPNKKAREENMLPLYRSFGLNNTEIQKISEATGQRQYYFKSSKGNRMMEFGLERCPLALAYCAASSKEEQAKVKEILKTYGPAHFNEYWLTYKGLHEHLSIYQAFTGIKKIS